MKINDLIIENQKIDEVSMAQVGQTAGKIIGGTGKAIGGAIGATAGGIKQFGKGFMSGLKGGYSSVGGSTSTDATSTTNTSGRISAAPATGSAAPATGSAAPATGSAAPATGSAAPATGSAAPATGSAAPAAPSTSINDILTQISSMSPTQKATLKAELDKLGIKSTSATPAAPRKRTGGRQAGTLSNNPRAVQRRAATQARRNAASATGSPTLAPFDPSLPIAPAVEESFFYSKFLDRKI